MRDEREHGQHASVLIVAAAGLIICTAPYLFSSRLAYAQAAAPSWSYTGSLGEPRSGHTATLLPNGKVLVAGGLLGCPPGQGGCSITNTAELYDPATGTWSFTGRLNVPRAFPSATLLPNGKVLVVGGSGTGARSGVFAEGTAELYDPATGRWSLTGNPHFTHWGGALATLLADGRVLVTGGFYYLSTLSGEFYGSDKAEIYDPATNTWSITGSLNGDRLFHTATLLPNGKVLVAGGSSFGEYIGSGIQGDVLTNQLYDPNTGIWSVTGNLNQGRAGHTATMLPGGFVLTTGGTFLYETSGSAETYNPTTGTWNYTGSLSRRAGHTATLLPDGQVLVAGGGDGESALGSAEVYDPATGTWRATAGLNTARGNHTATRLSNGKVLVVGGVNGDNRILQTAELYDPGPSSSPNPIDDAQFFVTQHYLDFLSREPEQGEPWTAILRGCPDQFNQDPTAPSARCDRLTVSAAFFNSPEFRLKGQFVFNFYRAAFGRLPEFSEIAADMGGVTGTTPAEVFARKAAFTNSFAQRAEFGRRYGPLSDDAYVAALLGRYGLNSITTPDPASPDGGAKVALAASELSSRLAAGTLTRAQVLRAVADSDEVTAAEYQNAFVAMQYYGYLRRTPEEEGYQAWLRVIGQDPQNVRQMVNGFVSSTEYRRRFGPN